MEEHKEEKKAFNQEFNRREVQCEVCGCKVKNAIGENIWELKSIGTELKVEVVGEIWVARARGQGEEVELTIMLYYHYTCTHHIYIPYTYKIKQN